MAGVNVRMKMLKEKNRKLMIKSKRQQEEIEQLKYIKDIEEQISNIAAKKIEEVELEDPENQEDQEDKQEEKIEDNRSYTEKDESCNLLSEMMQTLDKFNNTIDDVMEKFEYINNVVCETQIEQNEILHHIEFCELADEDNALLQDIKCVRNKRRDYKNLYELMIPIQFYFKSKKKERQELKELYTKLVEISNVQKTRIFTPKIRVDDIKLKEAQRDRIALREA